MGIPVLALAITIFSGVLGPYRPGSRLYWFGCAWFVLLSAILWHANRFAIVRLPPISTGSNTRGARPSPC